MNVRLPWMSRTDRRAWSSATTFAQLGELMARWLTGEIASRPGYAPNFGPDDESSDLVPTLAALCRAGYITTQSQPGCDETGYDGAHWRQRAAVQGLIATRRTLDALTAAATEAGLIICVNDHARGGVNDQAVITTTRDDEPMTAFGGWIGRADMALQWRGIERHLAARVALGTCVTVIAPEYGPEGNWLWTLLDQVAADINEEAQA